MGVTAELLAKMSVRQTGSGDFGGQSFSPDIQALLQLSDGVGANQADIFWADERTVASGANDDLDLAGVLANAFGVTIAAAELVAALIINRPRNPAAALNTTNLTIGVGTNPVTPGFMGGTTPTWGPIRPGGFLFFGAGDAGGYGVVTAGSADLLRIANSTGASAVYQIGILARSA